MTQNPDPNQPPQALQQPPAPQKPARTVLIALLGGAIILLLGIVIGMLIANANANRDAGTAAPSGEAAPSGTPSAEETVSEEEMQEVLDLIRAQPRREAEDPYAVGEVDAPVVLIEYADYRCSFCGK